MSLVRRETRMLSPNQQPLRPCSSEHSAFSWPHNAVVGWRSHDIASAPCRFFMRHPGDTCSSQGIRESLRLAEAMRLMTRGRELGEFNLVARNHGISVVFLSENARERDEIATTPTKSVRGVDFFTGDCIVNFARFRSSLSVYSEVGNHARTRGMIR